jgi:hypothetical protein
MTSQHFISYSIIEWMLRVLTQTSYWNKEDLTMSNNKTTWDVKKGC